MTTWVMWGLLGIAPWVAFFIWAWLTQGISPRRFVWPDVPKMKSARDAEERLLAPRMQANRMFYGPLFVIAVLGGGSVIWEVGAIGVAFITGGVTPALLGAVATLRAWLAVRGMRRAESARTSR